MNVPPISPAPSGSLRERLLHFVYSIRHLRKLGWRGDAIAALMAGAALLLRFLVDHMLPPGFPYLTFFPAVVLAAFLFGLRAGVVCAILSGLASWYFFMPPEYSFVLTGQTAIALAFYVFIVSIDIALIHIMHVAAEQLRADGETTARLYGQQRTMFQELQHRVANNMQFVAGLLLLYKRKAGEDPKAVVTALDDARMRLDTFSRIHRHLYDPAIATKPVNAFFGDLCSGLIDASGAPNVRCHVDMPNVQFDLTRLTPLSLIVVEAVTNALKHAFPSGKGAIKLKIEPLQGDRYALTISDDGKGGPIESAAAQNSLGLRIVQNLAQQIGGEVSYSQDAGTTVRVEFDGAEKRES